MPDAPGARRTSTDAGVLPAGGEGDSPDAEEQKGPTAKSPLQIAIAEAERWRSKFDEINGMEERKSSPSQTKLPHRRSAFLRAI